MKEKLYTHENNIKNIIKQKVVSFDEKKISRLDLEGKVEGELTLGGGPWAISHDGENLWVADSTQPKIWKVSNIYGDMEEPKPIKEKYFDLEKFQ